MTRNHTMRSHGVFLLLYLMGLCWGLSLGMRNGACPTGVTCTPMGPAESFLQCVGLPSTDTGPVQVHRLHSIMEALMDIYTFMRASVNGVPVLGLAGGLDVSLTGEPLHNEALVQMWLDVTMKPLLHSVSKQMLICLSSKNFSCSTYQLIVKELSLHFSEMDPIRQRWIYDFFMYPFLARDGVQGCVESHQNSIEWLMKNFGEFRGMARVKDFSALYMEFSGFEVLDLLSPSQKAEILLTPGVAGMDNGTIYLVFNSMMGHPGTTTTNWTTPGYSYPTAPPDDPSPLSIDHRVPTFIQVWNGVMEPVAGLVHEFVSLTNEKDVSEIRSTDLAQIVLNFTLSELADMYRPQEPSHFDPTDVEAWYEQVVIPVLIRFLPKELLSKTNISMGFHELFYLDHGTNDSVAELEDVCSLTLDQAECGLTDAVYHVAHVMNCAAQTNLTLNEKTVLGLLYGLTYRLSSLLRELARTDLDALAADIKQIFTGSTSTAVTQEHLTEPDFIQTWFQVKLLPLLPDVSPELLLCLSRKNFSCPVYQTIVLELSQHMMYASPEYQERIYENFIFQFLHHHNSSDARCMSNSSAEWLHLNFGIFSQFARITDFYSLDPHFSGLEALPRLSPPQVAQLLLLPLPTPPEKPVVVREVFSYLLSAPHTHFREVLYEVIQLAPQVNVSCALYTQMFVSLYGSIPSVSPKLEPDVWASIEDLISIAPQECIPDNITCPVTLYNDTYICREMSSSNAWTFSNMPMSSLCDVPLEDYACGQLDNFTANQLASLMSCDLPGNSSHSRVLWKVLLTKLSSIIDPALDILATTSTPLGSSAPEILDVLGEIRVSLLTDQDLKNATLIQAWFSRRLGAFLPHASGLFLRCLSSRNMSCSSYQLILQSISQDFNNMTLRRQEVVLNNYVLRFLSQNISGPGCVSPNSSQWLLENLGPFSQLVPITVLLELNPDFNPLDALPLLTPQQTAELLALPLGVDKDTVINMLFDLYMKDNDPQPFIAFLSDLPLFISQANLSCSNYRTLFNRLDLATISTSLEAVTSIVRTKIALAPYIPYDCVIYEGQCTVTETNETQICAAVNSTSLQQLIDQGQMNGRFCDFTVEQLSCASLSTLSATDVAQLLTCSRPVNSSGSRASWKLLLSKVPQALDPALNLLANTTLDPTQATFTLILDAIREIHLENIPQEQINHPLVFREWFEKLRPLLPSVSIDFLHCLTTKALNCSTFQYIVKVLSSEQPKMSLSTQMYVYTHFIKVFLQNNTADPSCLSLSNDSLSWVEDNLGAFSVVVPFTDLLILNPDLSAMDILPVLTPRQLAELTATPGQLQTPEEVALVMNQVPVASLPTFYDDLASALAGQSEPLPPGIYSALLDELFARSGLNASTPEPQVWPWMPRMKPLLPYLSPEHVGRYFSIVGGHSCSLQNQGVMDLNASISTFGLESVDSISDHIEEDLSNSLICYGSNFDESFYDFLETSFLGFPFPNLTSIISLMPHDQMQQFLNSMPVRDMNALLWHPDVSVCPSVPCELFQNYADTPQLLMTSLPECIHSAPTLQCVYPLALTATTSAEADLWFGGLRSYMIYMDKDMISPNATHNATCVSFRSLVNEMEGFNFTNRDFGRMDVFNTITAYLSSSSAPRCYNSNDPELNSTAYFANYIGSYFDFMTLDILLSLGPEQALQVFTVNLQNIALLNHSALPQNLTDYYTKLLYQQDNNFSPLLLPLLSRCVAPGQAFTQLDADQSMAILYNLSNVCIVVDPQIAAALAGNFGDNITVAVIEAMGQENFAMSLGQIRSISPEILQASMGMLGIVSGFNWAQSYAIVQNLRVVGNVKFSNATSVLSLNKLVKGFPASSVSSISRLELQNLFKDPTFIENLQTAPGTTQDVFIYQLTQEYGTSQALLDNIPDPMSHLIPRVRVVTLPTDDAELLKINKKTWKRSQAELFFSEVAKETSAAALNGTDNLSDSLLLGFTCTGVRDFQTDYINTLMKSYRRDGKNRVELVEHQLTCMELYIQEMNVTDFSLYLSDALLYYDYSQVPESSCRSYFEQLSDANFFGFSPTLLYIREQLFTNAQSCLGITNTSLTKDQITVLGNMCCILDSSYIQDSDPSILEQLMKCPELTVDQANAVEALLEKGNTSVGAVSTWNEQTLKDLGMLPLYLQTSFYEHFNTDTKREFLGDYLKVLRADGVPRSKIRSMKSQIRLSIPTNVTAGDTTCTVGEITQVTISHEAFPFDYTHVSQFNNCLSAVVVRDNLDTITEKVDDREFLRVVLEKLKELYSQEVPENQVQVLGPSSREATPEDISQWTITKLETLSNLMNSSEGPWDPPLARQVIYKYLNTSGNSLGTSELNAIGGINLCSLDNQTLSRISPESLRDADVLDISSCSLENKRALFFIATSVYSSPTRTTVSASSYQLIAPYMGGTNESYVKSLVNSNINMDLPTFTSIDPSVLETLSVADVQGLLGTNTPLLKSYENNTAVRSWISSRFQTDLETLGIGLQGGLTTTTTAPGATNSTGVSNTTVNTTGASNTTSAPDTTTTTAAGAGSTTTTASAASSTTTTAPAASSTTTTASAASSTTTTAPAASSTTTTAPAASSTTTTAPASGSTTAAGTTVTTVTTGTSNTTSGVSFSAPSGLYLLLLLLVSACQHTFT